MQTNPNEYEQAWQDGPDGAPAPAENPVVTAATAARDKQAREFAEAFNSETPVSGDPGADDSTNDAPPAGEQVAGVGSFLREKAGMQTDEDRKAKPVEGGDANTKLRGKQLDEQMKTAGA